MSARYLLDTNIVSDLVLLIAAQALSLGCTVVTDDEHEFQRVPELSIENWIRG